MKKIFVKILPAIVMAACLYACGRNNNTSEGAADPVEDRTVTDTTSMDHDTISTGQR